jgi:leukotriene-A4 hydrolase
MFSQCQAIHARALLPCADAPTAKFTYEATVVVPEWATALMSAVSLGAPTSAGKGTRTFSFDQSVPVPSYLVAIAVGDLRGVQVGPRSTVWSEPSVVDAAAWEFGECEKFLKAGEEITGVPYIWKRYDVLCMPPSFP